MIPVAIVTGFLGSGKTTLISRILHDPTFARTAVIVNELGVGLTRGRTSEEQLGMTTGCLCCAVRSDRSPRARSATPTGSLKYRMTAC
jgi:G3E family GTPase